MTDNTPGVEELMSEFTGLCDLLERHHGISHPSIKEEYLKYIRLAVEALVESRDALLVKCEGLEGHYQELDYMLDDVKAERDAAQAKVDRYFALIELNSEALDAMTIERDAAIAGLDKHCACEVADDGQITAQCGAHKAITGEREAAIAKLATKCGCVLANVSDGPHPELAAKDRMYAIEVCWYHEFVHKERDQAVRERDELLLKKANITEEHHQFWQKIDDLETENRRLAAQNAELREAAIWQWKINHGEHCTHDLNADDVCLADQEGSTGCCWPKPDCIVRRITPPEMP